MKLLLILALSLTAHAYTVTVRLSLSNVGTQYASLYRANGACPTTGTPSGGKLITSQAPSTGTYVYNDSGARQNAYYCWYAMPAGTTKPLVWYTSSTAIPALSMSFTN